MKVFYSSKNLFTHNFILSKSSPFTKHAFIPKDKAAFILGSASSKNNISHPLNGTLFKTYSYIFLLGFTSPISKDKKT